MFESTVVESKKHKVGLQKFLTLPVSIALHDLSVMAASLRLDIKRGRFEDVAEHLKTLHDGVRGLRTELDLRNDSAWGRQLAAVRADISNAVQSEIDSVPGRVRRILRQRPDKDISSTARVDSSEVEETAALIDFVAVYPRRSRPRRHGRRNRSASGSGASPLAETCSPV